MKIEEGKERHFVADNDGSPIESALKFIQFKDKINFGDISIS